MSEAKFTPGPWEYVPSTERHGPYVSSYGDICDCYTMSHPKELSTANGGKSKPIHFQGDMADANARLIAAAPDMYEALQDALALADPSLDIPEDAHGRWKIKARAALAKARGEI